MLLKHPARGGGRPLPSRSAGKEKCEGREDRESEGQEASCEGVESHLPPDLNMEPDQEEGSSRVRVEEEGVGGKSE